MTKQEIETRFDELNERIDRQLTGYLIACLITTALAIFLIIGEATI